VGYIVKITRLMSGLVAIVGRPNVGKSALFNRIVGKRIAIVHDEPGVTRDRITAEAEWRGMPFAVVDTGGICIMPGEKVEDPILQSTIEQIKVAIDSADLLVFVVDVKDGVVPLDIEVANLLRKCGKPVLVVANKADNQELEAGASEFTKLGFEEIFPVSAIHNRGVSKLLDAVVKTLGRLKKSEANAKEQEQGDTDLEEQPPEPIKIAIVGRPNVGKSSLINAITGLNRVIVSPIPGTTRDSVDVPFEIDTEGRRENFVFIDTAGIRKARSISTSVEFFSVTRAKRAIERCDLAVLVLDAETGIVELDKKIGGMIVDAQKACVLAVNKWDLFEEKVEQALANKKTVDKLSKLMGGRFSDFPCTMEGFAAWVHQKLFFLDHAPVIFLSAKTGRNVERLLDSIRYVAGQMRQKIPTSILNKTLHAAVESRQPPSSKGHRLKFFYATQTSQAPPTFLLFVNRVDLFTEPYKRYLADQIRRAFGYEGCPIVLIPRERPRK